ncbi:MAG: DUF2273 domain-containing protein [Oscillospiraceae bacterium]|jgi:uncharacterized membrane protein|nr:DUF2273 domain-containing protein [Oscillospiraceae bacterium]
MSRESDGFWKDILRPGTAACALLCALIGVAVALMALFIGFWKTLLIVLFFAAGWFIGKAAWLHEWLRAIGERIAGRRG